MFRVLVVDDDATSLTLLKACLKKWNYQVTTVKHVQEALSMLRIKSFDLVLSDIHMPDTNGFELLRQVDEEFNLPVILISADTNPEVIWRGVKNGAQYFLVKPVTANDVQNIWQYSLWWKKTKANNTVPTIQTNNNNGCTLSSASVGMVDDDTIGRRNKKFVWTSDLHGRFVEAILIIGYQKAVPANILDVMNVPGLTRGQVASHLQKYQRFLQRVLEGKINIEFSNWIDLNYYSSFVSGNPDLLLINQLREEQTNGNLAAHNPLRPPKLPHITTTIRAPNGSSSSSRYKSLPPYNRNEESTNRSENATLVPDSYTYFSLNVASTGMDNANLPNTYSEKMRGIVESNTFNSINNLDYNTNQMGYYNQNTLDNEQNTYSCNGGLIGEDINNMIPSASNVAPSSTAPLYNNFYSHQSFNMGGQGNNNFDYENNFNIDQLGNNHGDPSVAVSNHFENTSTMNAQQLGGEQMSDWFNNNGMTSTDSNIIQ